MPRVPGTLLPGTILRLPDTVTRDCKIGSSKMGNRPANNKSVTTYCDLISQDNLLRQLSPNRQLWARRRQAMESSKLRYTPLGPKTERGASTFQKSLDVLEILLHFTGLFRLGCRNAHQIEFREIDLEFLDLPKVFDGYTILHLSDLHIDCSPGIGQVIVNVSAGHQPDLCIMTGDFRAASDGPFEQVMTPMQQLIESIGARDGVVAVLGNHDDHKMGLAFEDRLDLRLLVNERIKIQRDDSEISLTGTDDVNRFYSIDAENALIEPLDGFGIALVHSPEMAHEADRGGHSLYLCGHTHGGQIALPGGKPLVTNLHRNRECASGLWRVGNMVGYTNPGAGVSEPAVRFFTRGEVTLFTLRRG